MAGADTSHSQRPAAVLHVDLDGARHIYAHHGWPDPGPRDPLFESGMEHLLSFLDENGQQATLFAIASDVDDPTRLAWLRGAVEAGHEIASHSLTHPEFDSLDHASRRRELAESKSKLEQTLGIAVRGFRAPSYQIDRATFELLAECGYAWDSSMFPRADFARRMRVPSILPVPSRPLLDVPMLELPLPEYGPAPFPFHPSYSLLLGQRYFAWGLQRHWRRQNPLVMLFHLADFAEPLDKSLQRGLKSSLFTLSLIDAAKKRQRCQQMLDRVRALYELQTTEQLVAAERARPARRLVLGVSTTHETGAALYDDHTCLAAISEERLDRIKFSTHYPPKKSIRAVVETSGVDPGDITDVVVAGLPAGPLAATLFRGQLEDTLDFHGWIDYFPHFNKVLYRLFTLYRAFGYRSVSRFLESEYGIRPRLHFQVHHLCHAASAYRTAPFEDAVVVTADGVGDDTSITISEGHGDRLKLLKLIRYPHSLGQFYTACTQILGFRANRHEGKITGLSGFGNVDPDLYERVRSTIRCSGSDFKLDKRFYSEGIVRGLSIEKIRRGEDLFEALQYRNYKTPLAKVIEGYSREDVAAVFQTILEEEIVALVRPFKQQTGLRHLCLAGGVFANVKANAALFNSLGFEKVYIFPHMGDGGLANGAALEFLQAKPVPFENVYWGPEYDDEQMENALQAAADSGLRYRRAEDLEREVANLLAEMKVVARFNGRMEFGPRALCNRSILYSASEKEANNWLNKRLGRTEFMPFAPVALERSHDKLFKGIGGAEHACKFMTIILDCTEFTIEKCPAIVHVDGTARPQLVNETINPSMTRILEHYEELTGIPLLVNTSFNMHEEPIVCSPEDAVRAFLDSRLDYLALGPFIAWIDEPASGEVAA